MDAKSDLDLSKTQGVNTTKPMFGPDAHHFLGKTNLVNPSLQHPCFCQMKTHNKNLDFSKTEGVKWRSQCLIHGVKSAFSFDKTKDMKTEVDNNKCHEKSPTLDM